MKARKNRAPQELLALLMELKAKRLGSLDPKLEKLYFKEEDRGSLFALSEDKAKGVLEEIFRNALRGYCGLSDKVCPFCLLKGELFFLCDDCPYGSHHGRCYDKGSDFERLKEGLALMGIKPREILPPEFYLSSLIRILAPLPSRTNKDYLLIGDAGWLSEEGERWLLIADKNGASFRGIRKRWRWGAHHPQEKEHRVIEIRSLISGEKVKDICSECDLETISIRELFEELSSLKRLLPNKGGKQDAL